MSIKRGVSFYSYQQSQFFKRLGWKDMIEEVHNNLKTDGVEIIDEATIRNYPFPTDEFVFDWNNTMARYNMKAVTMDVYLDVHQFREHVMTHREAAERLKNDIKIAAKLGFENVRVLCLVPIDVIEMALPTAEKYNVRIGKEIHAPLPIKHGINHKAIDPVLDPRMVDQIVDLVERTKTKHVGLVPDFGVFQYRPTDLAIDYFKRHYDENMVDLVLDKSSDGYSTLEILKILDEKYPDHKFNHMGLAPISINESCAKTEDIKDIVPYIVSIHGKFYHMTEIDGKPGQYQDESIDYATPIKYLKECGYEGYINSEFEGQRFCHDLGEQGMIDEVEQVRRHHEMLNRLINE
ncbi:MAG: TIM barrel protein [Eubacteriales bacterium]